MSLAGRRGVLRMALGAAVLPLVASRRALAADVASAPAAISPPACDMIYRRVLQRQLPDGAQITTSRDFRVRFSPMAQGGFMVQGEQVAARVTAPQHLAALARLEEQRVEAGIFPLLLDPGGHIVEGVETPASNEVATALEEVRRRFADHGGEARELLEALHASGAQLTAQLPHDLFAPVRDEVEQRETIVLPWGDEGEVALRFTASRAPDTGLMRVASREVQTSLAGDRRHTSEHWDLFPL